MKWSRINSQWHVLIPNPVKMIIETIIQLPSWALSKSQWMALIRVRSSHSPATEQLWPPPHTNQHKCCQSKTVLFQKVKLWFFWGHSKVQSWGDVLLLLHQMVLPKIQGDNLCPNLLAPSVLYLNLIMQRPDKREMSFLYQMLTKPSNWFAVQTRLQQCWSSIKTIRSTDWLVAPLCIIKLSIPLQLRLSKCYGLSAEEHSNTRPSSCKGETGRQDEERNTDTNLNCKKSEDAVKGGDVSQEERKRGWRLVSTLPPISKPAKADAYNSGVLSCTCTYNVQWPPKRWRCRMSSSQWAIQFKYMNSSVDREMFNDPRKRMLRLYPDPPQRKRMLKLTSPKSGCPLSNS